MKGSNQNINWPAMVPLTGNNKDKLRQKRGFREKESRPNALL